MLDNSPLAERMQGLAPLHRLPVMLEQGHLQALAVTESSYSSGEHCTFYEAARPITP